MKIMIQRIVIKKDDGKAQIKQKKMFNQTERLKSKTKANA